ncbi:hypothetical protein HY388_01915 [Candidatus Daviesbacteria bacterium]|nr:hypothetical protein [Candidatus Daviesbacteria bacterium]
MDPTIENRANITEELRGLVGRDLEQHEAGEIFRGPIVNVEIAKDQKSPGEKGFLSIYLGWIARRTPEGWRLWQEKEADKDLTITGTNLDFHHSFSRDAQGNITGFLMPYIGSVTIHSAGDNLKKEELLPKTS